MEGIYEEVRISPDGGNVKVTVHGMKGSGCQALQEKYKALGPQDAGEKTSEYYEAPVSIQSDVNVTR